MSVYHNFSPYYATPIVNDYLDVLEFRDIPTFSDDILFELTSTYQFRPDLLAYDLYKEQKLWWVFSVRNKDTIRDPIFDMVAGVKIYLPKLSTIKQVLSA
jgi:hypothetical protein